MTQVALLDRVETKYILGLSSLNTALQSLAGHYRVLWNGTDADGAKMPSGIYYARLAFNDSAKSIKMVLLK